MKRRLPIDRAMDRVHVEPSGCWRWTGAFYPTGYSRFCLDGHNTTGHRAIYRLLVGEPPAGLDLDHLCRNRACVNPLHLEPVTRRENLRRGDTLAAAHAEDRDCGFAGCKNCRRFEVAS